MLGGTVRGTVGGTGMVEGILPMKQSIFSKTLKYKNAVRQTWACCAGDGSGGWGCGRYC